MAMTLDARDRHALSPTKLAQIDIFVEKVSKAQLKPQVADLCKAELENIKRLFSGLDASLILIPQYIRKLKELSQSSVGTHRKRANYALPYFEYQPKPEYKQYLLDLRESIIADFLKRRSGSNRTRISSSELEKLIYSFIVLVAEVTDIKKIERLCREEIALLEQGFKKTVCASVYIPKYRKEIKRQIGFLLNDSPELMHEYIHVQRVTGIHEERCEHWVLSLFKYSYEEYNALDARRSAASTEISQDIEIVEVEKFEEPIEEVANSIKKERQLIQALRIENIELKRQQAHLTQELADIHKKLEQMRQIIST